MIIFTTIRKLHGACGCEFALYIDEIAGYSVNSHLIRKQFIIK
jgi:hypothetical protein